MIEFKGLNKWYPTKAGRSYVYKDLDLVLPMDKSVGIIGRNGAGKSTLIRMIGGADFPNSGEIRSNLSISWPLGLQGGTQGVMSGRENARFVARIHGVKDTREVEERVAEFADIGRYFNEPMKSYSNGMRARVMLGITTAFDFNFDVLLIDELTAVGDAQFKKKAVEVVNEKLSSSKVIMVHHGMAQLKQFCQAGLLIKNQSALYFDDIDEAIKCYNDVQRK